MEGLLGEIRLFAGNFAPENWQMCQGQMLTIQSNPALFSLLSNRFGGDAKVTFALPDLRSRVPVGVNGTATSILVPVNIGQQLGSATVTLTSANTPAHSHQVLCNSTNNTGDQNSPAGNFPAVGPLAPSGLPVNTRFANSAGSNSTMNPQSLQTVGSGTPFSNMMPTTAMNYIICTNGLYPMRS